MSNQFRFILLLALFIGVSEEAHADFFPKGAFRPYVANGHYPFWSKTWVGLERRVFVDDQGIPYVNYPTGKSYNTTTISLFALLDYDSFLESGRSREREKFLRLANWIALHQSEECGCWPHDFDLNYAPLDETIHKPWISAMTQGLAISVLTRAYVLTRNAHFLDIAERGMIPFSRKVEQGGIVRSLLLFGNAEDGDAKQFYEEYPTQPDPTYTLNGFMFSLIGLYDLSRLSNPRAEELFQKGLRALRFVVPLYDTGDCSSYDLVHLTRPPRPVHRDVGYHLVHITLLNAIGSATGDSGLLWYRDHWNSYGFPLQASGIWFEHFGVWLLFRQTIAILIGTVILLAAAFMGFRRLLRRKRKPRERGEYITQQAVVAR